MGRGTVAGIVTWYGLDSPRIESRRRWNFSTPVHTGPGPHLQWVPGFISGGVKQPGRGIYHWPRPGSEVKEIVQIYLYSRFGPSWPFIGWTYALSLIIKDIDDCKVQGDLPACTELTVLKYIEVVFVTQNVWGQGQFVGLY